MNRRILELFELGADNDRTAGPPFTLLIPWTLKLSDDRRVVGWWRWFIVFG